MHGIDFQGPVSRRPCALLQLDFLTNAMHLLYALVRKSNFSKAQGFGKPAPEGHVNATGVNMFNNKIDRYFKTPGYVWMWAMITTGLSISHDKPLD